MASLSFRRSSLTKQDQNSKLIAASSYNVMACKPGGFATSTSTGLVMTFAGGHGFAAGDKALIRPGATQVYSGSQVVASVTATTVTLNGATNRTVNAGDAVYNLGADSSSTSTPAYDGGYAIYSDPAGVSALSGAKAATNSDGEYQYWHKGGPIWELMLSGSTVVEFDASSMFGGLLGHVTLSEPRPSISGFNPSDADMSNMRIPFRLFGAGSRPLVSMWPFAPTDAYQVIMRVGERANYYADSGTLGYFSEKITISAVGEHQAVYGINQYYGSGTNNSPQYGVHGIAQSYPGTGNTTALAAGINGVFSHNVTTNTQAGGPNYDGSSYPEGGTTTFGAGVMGQTQTGTSTATASSCLAMYGVFGQVNHRSTAVTTNLAAGVYGKINAAASSCGVAVAGRFDQPDTDATAEYAMLLHAGVGNIDPVLAFYGTSGLYRLFKYDTANGYFQLGGALKVDAALTLAGQITNLSTNGPLTLGLNTDVDISGLVFNRLTADVTLSWDESDAQIRASKSLGSLGCIRAGGDESFLAGFVSLTNVSDVTANSTGLGTIKFKGATARDSAGFIKIYVNSTTYYVPVFAAITG